MMALNLSPDEMQALWLSVKVATCCVLLGIIPAIGLAWLLARCEFWGKSLVEALVMLPLVLPPVVPGYLLLLLFGRQGAIGGWLDQYGIQVAFHWKGAVLASLVMCLPLFVQSIRLALQQQDIRLEQAAQLLGASRLRVFFTVTLPLCWSGILVGAVLAFGRSLGEFGATITFVGNINGETRTLPLAIYSAIQNPAGEALALRLIGLSVLLALAALLMGNWLNQRHQSRLGHRHA